MVSSLLDWRPRDFRLRGIRSIPSRSLAVRRERLPPTPGFLDSIVAHDNHWGFMDFIGLTRPKQACELVLPILGAFFSVVIHATPVLMTFAPSVVVHDNGSVVAHDTRKYSHPLHLVLSWML